MDSVNVDWVDTVKEKLECVYVSLANQHAGFINHGADPESFSLFASGPICQGLMNHWPPLGMRWRKGKSYLGSLNQRWRVFMNTEQCINWVYTTCNVGYCVLDVLNFPYTQGWHEEYVNEEWSDCPVVPRFVPHSLSRQLKFHQEPQRLRYDPREGF
jgi:hypothetical protein